jgi:hypothetical protein
LRLVLILDHITDWACRYREGVIQALQEKGVPYAPSTPSTGLQPARPSALSPMQATVVSLSLHISHLNANQEGSTRSINSDIPSTSYTTTSQQMMADGGLHHMAITLEQPASITGADSAPRKLTYPEEADRQHAARVDNLRKFDTSSTVIRNSRLILSRAMGLCITENNVELLFNSKPNDQESVWLFRRIIKCLEVQEPLFLLRDTLAEMELAWTGRSQERDRSYNGAEKFKVLLTFSAYLAPDWQQVREFSYLAVSSSAERWLYRRAYGKIRERRTTFSWDSESELTDTSVALRILKYHLGASAHMNLTGCLYKASVSPVLEKRQYDMDFVADDIFRDDPGKHICKMKSAYRTRDVIWSIYRDHVVGRNEPSVSFMHVASRLDLLELDHSPDSKLPSVWSTYQISPLEAGVLAYSINSDAEKSPRWCLFILDMSQKHWLANNLHSNRIMSTQRLGLPPGLIQVTWNSNYKLQRWTAKNDAYVQSKVDKFAETLRAINTWESLYGLFHMERKPGFDREEVIVDDESSSESSGFVDTDVELSDSKP